MVLDCFLVVRGGFWLFLVGLGHWVVLVCSGFCLGGSGLFLGGSRVFLVGFLVGIGLGLGVIVVGSGWCLDGYIGTNHIGFCYEVGH